MSVRHSLLAILDQGPCYGYQLRSEFDRRTGSTWPLNVGQIYNTLDRLEQGGLVAKDAMDARGHVVWRITEAGSTEVRAWLASPVERAPGTRDELAIKLAVAATLPGVEVSGVIDAQRAAARVRVDRLRVESPAEVNDPVELARALVVDAMLFAAEAELRWLDSAAERVARHPDGTLALALSADAPRRGRPARTPAAGSAVAG
ncbi:PadR family transcriptional regulator [Microbacterium sp.]|uniref:PadR family transcriptional regulator n=1 Tax=Microbacterium sp. TaxID=51671 RepID=UPI0025D254EC|nr:PadR family transcriptional regulator [Microbacterium sp.]